MTVRQGLPLGAEQTGSARKATFRALIRQHFKLGHYPAGARAFKDAKLYPAAAGKGPSAGLKAIALLARANPTGSTAATGRDKPDLGGMIGSWKTP